MPNLFKKISSAQRNRATYRIGLLQTKAYRALKAYTTQALTTRDISSIEWAFLGLLFESPKGVRAADAAAELGVEAPFVSVLLKRLEKKELVISKKDQQDSRAKCMYLTKKGTAFVSDTERYLRDVMRPLVSGSSTGDILSYITVLEHIVKNIQQQKTTLHESLHIYEK